MHSQITNDQPASLLSNRQTWWRHLDGITLADPDYDKPGRIDILLGVSIFVEVIRHGRRMGPHGTPTAINTAFGWVLAGDTGPPTDITCMMVSTHLTSAIPNMSGDDILKRFWEIDERSVVGCTHTQEERTALDHFKINHTRNSDGRLIVPLPKRSIDTKIGESRSQAVRPFLSFERSALSKGIFPEIQKVIQKYFNDGHAEEVPLQDLNMSTVQVFYMPMHVVYKDSSTTTKVRAVFDASASTSTGISLNSILMVGPTVHPPLVDVLIRFRKHHIGMIADVSRMYRAVLLTDTDKDLHRFVWRNDPKEQLKDCRMTRLTFGVSASSFIANMCVLQNAIDFEMQYPQATEQVKTSFYVDDYLGGADTQEEAIK